MSGWQANIPSMEPIIKQVLGQMHTEYEDGVLKAVQSYGFDVDKDRLLQALTDARAFYEEGCRAAMRMSEWISVKERLPEGERRCGTESEAVLVYRGYYDEIRVGYYDYHWEEWYTVDDLVMGRVTHWMPLPEPPKEG